MSYSKTLLAIGAGLIVVANAHFTEEQVKSLGPVRVEDMWCFDPAYKVGTPNMFYQMNECLNDMQANKASCDNAFENFCAVHDIHPDQCQLLHHMFNPLRPESTPACRESIRIGLEKLAARLGECTATQGYLLWETYIAKRESPHGPRANNRRMLSSSYGAKKASPRRSATVARMVHQAIDKLVACHLTSSQGACFSVMDSFNKASNLAFLGNLRINTLTPEEVHGKRFGQLIGTHEGDAVVNHGDIEYHFDTSEFWQLFCGLTTSTISPNYHCDKFIGLDGQESTRCFRHAYVMQK